MLYILKLRPSNEAYDCAYGFVVRTKTPNHARKLASSMAGCEGQNSWLSSKFSSCRILKSEGSPEVILRDFNAG